MPGFVALNTGMFWDELIPELNTQLGNLRGNESGTSAPGAPATWQFWADTTTGKMKTYNGSTWVTVFDLGVQYGGLLPLGGGTMTGPINGGGFNASNFAQATASTHLVRFDQVVSKQAGGLFDAAVGGIDPVEDQHFVTRGWAESNLGGTLVGAFTVGAGSGDIVTTNFPPTGLILQVSAGSPASLQCFTVRPSSTSYSDASPLVETYVLAGTSNNGGAISSVQIQVKWGSTYFRVQQFQFSTGSPTSGKYTAFK